MERSFQGACRRVVEYGKTTYRRRTLTLSHLSREQIRKVTSTIPDKPTKASIQKPCSSTGRHRVLVWNCGGLAYQDFMYWLAQQHPCPDVIILAETRLAYDMEHTTDQYLVVHSSKLHAGVMIMIHKTLAPAHRVSWRASEPGRIVHVRVYGDRGHLNVIGYYQQRGNLTLPPLAFGKGAG